VWSGNRAAAFHWMNSGIWGVPLIRQFSLALETEAVLWFALTGSIAGVWRLSLATAGCQRDRHGLICLSDLTLAVGISLRWLKSCSWRSDVYAQCPTGPRVHRRTQSLARDCMKGAPKVSSINSSFSPM
jgi:hypothetical protein